MMMGLSLLQEQAKCTLGLNHVYREHNIWADQLTHAETDGFDPANLYGNQYPPDESPYGFWTVRATY